MKYYIDKAQDGGQFDTSYLNDLIDNYSQLENQEQPIQQKVVDNTIDTEQDSYQQEQDNYQQEQYYESQLEETEMQNNYDLLTQMLNDDSFDNPVNDNAVKRTSRYAQEYNIEQENFKISQSQASINKDAFNYYKQKGLSDVQAAAIVGNLAVESGINPLAGDGDKRGGIGGVAQFDPSRSKDLMIWAKSKGLNYKDKYVQLEFVQHEAEQRGDLQAIANYDNVRDATINFGRRYERPNERYANWEKRVGHANIAIKQYGYNDAKYNFNPLQNTYRTNQKQDTPFTEFLQDSYFTQNNRQENQPTNIVNSVKPTNNPDYLKLNVITNTGNYDLPDEFKLFNGLAQATTFISGALNSEKKKKQEQQMLQEQLQKPQYENYGLNGISNLPNYKI